MDPARAIEASGLRKTFGETVAVADLDLAVEVGEIFGLVGPDHRPLADVLGTIVTYTVDRLAYSPSPPVVFAVVDFDGGGRPPVELTDVDADDVAIGGRVEMTFRRLFTADGIHNYFWKARPVREGGS